MKIVIRYYSKETIVGFKPLQTVTKKNSDLVNLKQDGYL